ncbi:MAG: succinate dehydrogenase assembly factor 2 [Gammaproteobacteria bacterium]
MEEAERISRIRWACRRGIRELDLWFLGYLKNNYPTASENEKQTFEQLLQFPDQELFDWFMEKSQPVEKSLVEIIGVIRKSAN